MNPTPAAARQNRPAAAPPVLYVSTLSEEVFCCCWSLTDSVDVGIRSNGSTSVVEEVMVVTVGLDGVRVVEGGNVDRVLDGVGYTDWGVVAVM